MRKVLIIFALLPMLIAPQAMAGSRGWRSCRPAPRRGYNKLDDAFALMTWMKYVRNGYNGYAPGYGYVNYSVPPSYQPIPFCPVVYERPIYSPYWR